MKYSIPLELIELEEANYHLAVPCKFISGGVGLWVIDTGASKTVFDKSLVNFYDPVNPDDQPAVQSAGIGSDLLDTSLAILHPFLLGKYRITSMKAALIDLSHINKLYFHATEREICGLIGSDFLLEQKAIIDYGRLKITFFATPLPE
jgi:hypothetical protein